MGSILNKPASPERFYIYRVTDPGDNPKIHYLDKDFEWDVELDRAMLLPDVDTAVHLAKVQAADAPPRVFFNVSRLTLEIDPLYSTITVNMEQS